MLTFLGKCCNLRSDSVVDQHLDLSGSENDETCCSCPSAKTLCTVGFVGGVVLLGGGISAQVVDVALEASGIKHNVTIPLIQITTDVFLNIGSVVANGAGYVVAAASGLGLYYMGQARQNYNQVY